MSSRNVGVAFGIPEPYSGQLQAWRDRLGDPNARSIPPHVTLLPPTVLPDDRLGETEEHLGKVAQDEQAFELHLRGAGTFQPVSPVVFVSLTAGISDCERVEAKVRSGSLTRDLSFPYHPHVTVAHDLPEPVLARAYQELAAYEARFRVWGFTLFEQGSDGVWRPQRDFPFGGALPRPNVRDC